MCLDHTNKYKALFKVGFLGQPLGVFLLVIGCNYLNKPTKDLSVIARKSVAIVKAFF